MKKLKHRLYKIIDVHPRDAHYTDRHILVGMIFEVYPSTLRRARRCPGYVGFRVKNGLSSHRDFYAVKVVPVPISPIDVLLFKEDLKYVEKLTAKKLQEL